LLCIFLARWPRGEFSSGVAATTATAVFTATTTPTATAAALANTTTKVVQKILHHNLGRCMSLVSQNGGFLD
jgi:hypothetical protein